MTDDGATKDHHEFWQFVEKTSQEVERWPDWKKEGWDMLEGSEMKAGFTSEQEAAVSSASKEFV
jgi:hypothetical protein